MGKDHDAVYNLVDILFMESSSLSPILHSPHNVSSFIVLLFLFTAANKSSYIAITIYIYIYIG
jgi:hypothetical protein